MFLLRFLAKKRVFKIFCFWLVSDLYVDLFETELMTIDNGK